MTLLETLNSTDHFAALAGAKLTEIREGFARAELTVDDCHINGAGVCQGGVIYTLADFAFAAVANCRGITTLGISNTITLIKSAVKGERLIAECTEVVNHHKLPYCDIKVMNQDGDIVAVMTGLSYRLKKEFPFDGLM